MRGETDNPPPYPVKSVFQSTPLMRGETKKRHDLVFRHKISIHSPHARGDQYRFFVRLDLFISIHSPHARGDFILMPGERAIKISIHSPHARGDLVRGRFSARCFYFNPLPSCEGRLSHEYVSCPLARFQSTPLMRGETNPPVNPPVNPEISIHSPHARGDDVIHYSRSFISNFNPLPSCEGRR